MYVNLHLGLADAHQFQKSELGPHADEDQMPESLRRLLEKGAKVTLTNQIGHDGRLVRVETIANETKGIMPILRQLCEQDQSISTAYLCHPAVTYVSKMAKEGGFCGYRNIQMQIAYLQDSKSKGHELFPGRLPSILDIQDKIEQAWDAGFYEQGRVETGGIRGTRKFIGTPEVQLQCL